MAALATATTAAKADIIYNYVGKPFDPSLCQKGYTCVSGPVIESVTFQVPANYTGTVSNDAFTVLSLQVEGFPAGEYLCGTAYSPGITFKNGVITTWSLGTSMSVYEACNEDVAAVNTVNTGNGAADNAKGYVGSSLDYGANTDTPGTWMAVTNPQFYIVSPQSSADYTLDQDYTSTDPIPFVANSSDTTMQMNWNNVLAYQTSGGKGGISSSLPFTTSPGMIQPEVYTNIGGQVTSTVTQGSQNQKVTFFITGTSIPDTTITSELDSLYNGKTPNLMTGIAEVESSYAQFSSRALYGVNAFWPTEGPDGGSHVGLMMDCVVPTSKKAPCGNDQKTWAGIEWNWQTNASNGVTLFTTDKVHFAKLYEKRLVKSVNKIVALTPSQLEDMAVGLYGPSAKSGFENQEYIPTCVGGTINGKDCVGGTWEWEYNTQNNPGEVLYVANVRKNLQ
jgi:hypothetical protein